MTATAKLRLKAMALTLSFDNAAQGWFIPTWVADKFDIHPDKVAKQWIAAHPELVKAWTQGIQ
jgi:ABC-type proline/glycine betaine transport system substrate-binding protein